MLVDANLLLYATDTRSPHHDAAARWWVDTLGGDRRVGIAWQTLGAFVRIVTHPRVTARPLDGTAAWTLVDNWLSADVVWIPPAGERTASILGRMLADPTITANLVPDAMLAALAIEHGLTVMTADTDFGRFPDVRAENPLR